MALWIFKQEPTCYGFADLQRDKSTIWDGVRNALAKKNLRQVKRGDRILFYHTGKEKAVVGVMRAIANAMEAATAEDPTGVEVTVEAIEQLARPVSLAEIKGDPLLKSWNLVRLPRLSVLPVTESQWRRIEELAAGGT